MGESFLTLTPSGSYFPSKDLGYKSQPQENVDTRIDQKTSEKKEEN
jgi:hypothetical protein